MRLPSRTAATPPVLLLVVAGACGAPKALPTSHKQFSVRIETTAHQLNSTQDYPPYKRYMTVHYDHAARRARVDYDPVPHMPPKSYVRRYDLEFEWMVMEVREELEEAGTELPRLQELREENRVRVGDILAELTVAFESAKTSADELENARALTARLQYLQRIEDEIHARTPVA